MGAAATHAAWREGLHGLILMQEKGICKSNAKEKGHDSKDNLYTICQNTAITSCAESQEWLNSLSLFSAMGHHQTAVSFATVMTAFQEMSSSSWPWRWQAPLSLFSELTQSGLQVDPFTTSTVVAACASHAWEISLGLCCAPNSGDAPFNVMMNAYSKNGRWEEALCLFYQMQCSSLEVSANTFSILIEACGKSKKWTLSLQLFRDMGLLRITPNALSFGAAINACSCSGRWEQALCLFTSLDEQSREPLHGHHDVLSYTALMSACEQGGQWQFAIELFALCSQSGLEPDTVMYNSLLSAWQTGSQWQGSLNSLLQMRSHALKPDTITTNTATSAFEPATLWHIAAEMITRSKSYHLQPDDIAFNTVISSLDKGQHWPLAILSVDEMALQRILPSCITMDATAHALQTSSEWILAIAQLTRTVNVAFTCSAVTQTLSCGAVAIVPWAVIVPSCSCRCRCLSHTAVYITTLARSCASQYRRLDHTMHQCRGGMKGRINI